MQKQMTRSIATDVLEREPRLDPKIDSIRVDYLLESRHRFVSATPHFITVEHDGEELRVAVPNGCPDCEFTVTSVDDDLLFLIGSQPAEHDGRVHRGAVVIARMGKNGVYFTELWHETHRSFVKRICGGESR